MHNVHLLISILWGFPVGRLVGIQICAEMCLCAGVTFMYECVMGVKAADHVGCLLADEMGLG